MNTPIENRTVVKGNTVIHVYSQKEYDTNMEFLRMAGYFDDLIFMRHQMEDERI